jgi:PKD repeat protein
MYRSLGYTCFFIFSLSIVFAQQPISIVSTDMPVAGNVFYNDIDTIPSGLNPGPKGPNQMWNFSSLYADLKDTVKWMLPASTPYGSTFNSNSNLAATNNDTNYIFFNNSTNVFKITGVALWLDTIQSVVVTTFTGSNDLYKFPTTYNGNFSGTYGFTQNITLNGNQIRIEFTSNYTDTIDAWGIVQTPYGYYEALRQKRVERTRTVIKALPPLWVTVSDTRDTTTDYNFLCKETKQQLIDFNFDTLGNVSRIIYSTILPKPIARFTYSGSGGNYSFTNTTYNTSGTTYSWNFGDGTPASNAVNPTHTYTANGQYNVCLTATNSQGSSTFCQTITVSGVCPAISANLNFNNATCGAADGSASVAPQGGTPPYSYQWSNNQTTATINNLAAGSYTVTITDANNCTATATANISNTGAPSVSYTATNALCYALCNGSIDLTITGGIAPYSVNWSSGPTTQDITNLCAGNYSVTVTDNANCQAIVSVSITEPNELFLTAAITDASSSSANDGSIDLSVTGGIPQYNFYWSNGQATEDISDLACGYYSVTVADNNGCTVSEDYLVDCSVENADMKYHPFIHIYPNPTSGKIFAAYNESVVVKADVYNTLGENIQSHTLTLPGWIDLSVLPKGIYIVKIQGKEFHIQKKILVH